MATDVRSVVAITGVAGQLGGTLAQLLEADDRVGKIVGIDVRPPNYSLTKLHFARHDVTAPGLDALFRAEGVSRVAHFAFLLDTIHDRGLAHRIDVDGSRNVLQAAAAAGAARVVFASSSVVFGAHPDNPPFIPEDHVKRPHPRVQYTLDKVEVEGLCESFGKEHPETRVAVLRPVTIVGPRMNNFISRFMLSPVLLIPRGYDPPWQFVHETDCARAAQTMLFNDLSGAYNLGADGTIRLTEFLALSGRPMVRVPRRLLKASADFFWFLRLRQLSEINGPQVDYLCYPPVLDNSKLKREAGFAFRYTSREAIEDFFKGREAEAPMNYRLRMLLQIIGSAAILAFAPNNVSRLIAFPVWWFLTFRWLNRRELVMYAIAVVVFTVLDYLTLSHEIFKFTHPDFLLMPCYEPLIWGYLLLHTVHMVSGPLPQGSKAVALAWAVVFTLPFLVWTDQVVLFEVSAPLLVVGLTLFHEPYDLAYVGYFLVIGTVWEYVGVWSGQWSYPGNPPGGVAPWFLPMWGGVALALRRLVMPLLRNPGPAHSPAGKAAE